MHDVTKLSWTTGGFLPFSQLGCQLAAIEVATDCSGTCRSQLMNNSTPETSSQTRYCICFLALYYCTLSVPGGGRPRLRVVQDPAFICCYIACCIGDCDANMGVVIRATAILLLSTFITLQAGCRQVHTASALLHLLFVSCSSVLGY